MKKKFLAYYCSIGIMLSILTIAEQAFGALGEPASSVDRDRLSLKAAQRTKSIGKRYSVQELQSASIVVHEFLTPSGDVFAITWNGLARPDLPSLLGSFADEYAQAVKGAPHRFGGRYSQIETSNLVVEKWGRAHNIKGRAYLKALKPPGVNVEEIN